jgi:hypothetical protein
MASDPVDLLISLGLGWVIGKGSQQLGHPDLKRLSRQRLEHFYMSWSPSAKAFNRRKLKLAEYELDKVIYALEGSVRNSYIEALNCFIFGRDIAASNMICLSLETLIRDITNDKESSLLNIIDDLVKKKNLSPDLQDGLHQLRKIRNRHSHTVAKLKELTLLNLFQAVGDIIKELGYGS